MRSMGKHTWEELGESKSPIEAVSPGKEQRAGNACPFLHTAVLGEDGGSSCEMLTPRSATSLSPCHPQRCGKGTSA